MLPIRGFVDEADPGESMNAPFRSAWRALHRSPALHGTEPMEAVVALTPQSAALALKVREGGPY